MTRSRDGTGRELSSQRPQELLRPVHCMQTRREATIAIGELGSCHCVPVVDLSVRSCEAHTSAVERCLVSVRAARADGRSNGWSGQTEQLRQMGGAEGQTGQSRWTERL